MTTAQREIAPEDRVALHSIDLEVLGERIRRARLEKKVSQRDLSAGLFTSAYLSSLELGKTRPTFDTLINLSQRLDKSVDFFLRQTSGMAGELDEEQARILEVRLALLTAQTTLERAADDRSEKALQQVALHLARLSSAERARYYYLHGKFYNMKSDPIAAIAELEEARHYLQESYDLELEVLIENALGHAHYLQRRIMPALTHYLAGLEQINSAKETFTSNLKWKLLMNVANCYLALNDWDQAIGSFREALEQAGSAMDLPSQAELFYGLAYSYGEQGDFQRACLNLGRSLQIYEQVEDQRLMVRTRNALADMQAQTGQYDSAEAHVNEVLRLSQFVPLSDRCMEVQGLVTMAIIRQRQGKLTDASKSIDRALELREHCGSVIQVGRLFQTAAEVQADIGNKDLAESYYKQALEVLEPSGLPVSLSDVYHSYGQRLRGWGEVDRAFEYMEKAYRQRERGRADGELSRK